MRQQKKFSTRSQKLAKRMCEIMNCSCEARLEGEMFTFYFDYNDETVQAHKQAKSECYTKDDWSK